MNRSLFSPFPDEHIYSWLVRLYKLSGYADFLAFQESLSFNDRFLHFNKLFSKSTDALLRLFDDRRSVLSEHTLSPLWQLSVGSLLDSYLPLGRFMHMNEQQLFGFDQSWHSCKKCREEDLVRYGTSYWHVQHQIPSVFECSRHQVILDRGITPVKNLFTECLPHDVEEWVSVVESPSKQLRSWQKFLLQVNAMCIEEHEYVVTIHQRIIDLLGLNETRASKRRDICEKQNSTFEDSLGSELLRFIFRDYARPTKRGKTNILASMFVSSNQPESGRNPIYYVVLAYWLREELGI